MRGTSLKFSLSDAVFISLTLFCVGYFFTDVCVFGEYGGFEYCISEITPIWIFLLPAAFFRTEKRNGRLSVLRPFLLVLPAFALMLLCPLILWIFGFVFFAPAYTAVLSLFLLTSAVFSVCTFITRIVLSDSAPVICCFTVFLICSASAFTSFIDKQELFIILSFPVLLVSLAILSHTHKLYCTLLFAAAAETCLALLCANADGDFLIMSAIYGLQNGVLDLRCVVKLVSVSALFFSMTALAAKYGFRIPWEKRTSPSPSDSVKSSVMLKKILTCFIPVIAITVANVAVRAIPERFTVADADGYNIYSLPKSARKYLASIQDDVTIYKVSYGDGNFIADTLVSKVSSFSSKISVTEIDMTERPDFLDKYYGDTYPKKEYGSYSLVVTCKDRYKVIPLSEIISGDSEGNYVFNGKNALLSAIVTVTLDRTPTVKILELSDDTLPDDSFLDSLENMGLTLSVLADGEKISCDILIIATDGVDVGGDRADEITEYINGGGKVILITAGKNLGNISHISEQCGITENTEGTVLDDYSFAASPIYTVAQPTDHGICSPVNSNSVIYPAPHALTLKNINGYTASPLLTTSEQGYIYSESDGEDFTRSEYGIYTTAAIAENNRGGCLVRFTSPDIFCEEFDLIGKAGALFSSAVSYLCDIPYTVNFSEIGLALPAICMSSPERRIIAVSCLIFIPALPVCLYAMRRFSRANET